MPSGTDTTSAMLPGANGTTVPLGGTGTVSSIDPSLNRSLSHVTQIGNNTGSLPSKQYVTCDVEIFVYIFTVIEPGHMQLSPQ